MEEVRKNMLSLCLCFSPRRAHLSPWVLVIQELKCRRPCQQHEGTFVIICRAAWEKHSIFPQLSCHWPSDTATMLDNAMWPVRKVSIWARWLSCPFWETCFPLFSLHLKQKVVLALLLASTDCLWARGAECTVQAVVHCLRKKAACQMGLSHWPQVRPCWVKPTRVIFCPLQGSFPAL